MADNNGNDNYPLLATQLGAIAFDEVAVAPVTNTYLSEVGSVGLYESISFNSYEIGEDIADYFSFTPSGLNTVTITSDLATPGSYANLLWIIPTSGVSEVSGEIISTSYGGEHLNPSSRFATAVDESAEALLRFAQSGSANVSADFSNATWARDEPDGLNAVWTLDGSPVVFEVSGFQLTGNNFNGDPNDVLEVDEIYYQVEIAPRDRAFGDSGPGSLFFIDTYGVAETHTGGDAVDVYQFAGSQNDFAFNIVSDDQIVVTYQSLNTAIDTLIDIERVKLNDGYLAFDTDGNAGQMYRLYQAAFDRDPDHAGLGHWINTFDNEVFDLVGVAEEFLMSEEFQTRFGTSETLDDNGYLTLLYNNVLDRTPDQAGFDFWSDQQEAGISRADMLRYFSESVENYANVADEIDMGIFYLL